MIALAARFAGWRPLRAATQGAAPRPAQLVQLLQEVASNASVAAWLSQSQRSTHTHAKYVAAAAAAAAAALALAVAAALLASHASR